MNIIKLLSNLPGSSTQRKIVVIESDDWGSLRAPSKEALQKMQKEGLPVGDKESIRFNLYDDLADQQDLESLFEVLFSVKDKNNHPAVFTAMSLVTNPDFERIEKEDFQTYYYKTLPESLALKNRSSAWNLWQEGYTNDVFVAEFHGREHLNVPTWMRALQQNHTMTKTGFKHQFWGFREDSEDFFSYQAAFNLMYKEDLSMQHDIIKDGLMLFEKLHDRKARFFVPPNGYINNDLLKTAADYGVKYVSTAKIQKEALGDGKTRKNFRYVGMKNKHQQMYLTRNAFFEPSSNRKTNWIDACLKEIEIAFKFKKPANISSHRVNYIGAKEPKNRDNGLKQLSVLLQKIKQNWPDVEFMTSTQLGEILRNGN